MIVDGDSQLFLADLLADHILIEKFLDLQRLRKRLLAGGRFHRHIVGDDLVADVNALVTDKDGGTCDQFFYVILTLVAE
jgi:hypothetical protein